MPDLRRHGQGDRGHRRRLMRRPTRDFMIVGFVAGALTVILIVLVL
jgi:predicted nucleic acid-binding Zn ribbon protein